MNADVADVAEKNAPESSEGRAASPVLSTRGRGLPAPPPGREASDPVSSRSVYGLQPFAGAW